MVIDSGNEMSKFFSKVYMWMFIGLLVSGGAAYFTAHNMAMMKFVYGSFGFILLLELVVVLVFSALRKKVSPLVAKILFLVYSLISGLTLSSIFIVYKIGSVGMVFLSAALMFALLAIYGYTTKNDLSSIIMLYATVCFFSLHTKLFLIINKRFLKYLNISSFFFNLFQSSQDISLS